MTEHPDKQVLELLAKKELAGEPFDENDAKVKEHAKNCAECKAYLGVYTALFDIIDGDIFFQYMKERVVDQRMSRLERGKEKGSDVRSER